MAVLIYQKTHPAARQVLDEFPKRTGGSVADLYVTECADRAERVTESSGNLGKYNATDELLGESMMDSFDCASNQMDEQYIIDQLRYCSNEEIFELGELYHALTIKTTIWLNNMICGYVGNGMLSEAFAFFVKMGNLDIVSNHYTYSILLSACGSSIAVQVGKQLHAQIVNRNFWSLTVVANSALTMYIKFGMIEEAENLFQGLANKNHISWTAFISGLYHQKAFYKALTQFSSAEYHDYGCALHAQVIKHGMMSTVFIGTAIIEMYSKCAELGKARKQLKEMGHIASCASWNTVITGLVHNGEVASGLEVFHKILNNDKTCDEYTCSITLKVRLLLPSFAICRQVHSNLEDAEKVFCLKFTPDDVIFNAMIKAYSLHCGLVQEGKEFFESITRDYGIPPEENHYSCVVDLLSRSGLLESALKFIDDLPIEPQCSNQETFSSRLQIL
ncbi:hypothetical protein HAX54_002449 [Datura stramonium]|uniref:Pentatricopeptide repeat-containing protein n=1 Tax=Datura stramonium TaxID=4076 RepID=A0ABS8RSZ2_DATST|nr:hypothetical protein [Datura stramonium]